MMRAIRRKARETDFKAGLPGFLALCEAVDFSIEPFQRKIATAFFAGTRELLVLLPRGNGKSRLVASLAVHHLLVTDRPAVTEPAEPREQRYRPRTRDPEWMPGRQP